MSVKFRASACGGALLALAMVSGCGGSDEPVSPALVIEKSRPGDAPAGGATTALELPASFPRDVPRHPGARVEGVRVSADQGMSLTLEIEEDVEEVARFYADSFAAEGWSTQVRTSQGGTAIFADKGNRSAAATVVPSERGAEVNIIVAEMARPAGG